MEISNITLNKKQKVITVMFDNFIEYWEKTYKEDLPLIRITDKHYEDLIKAFGNKKPESMTYKGVKICRNSEQS